LHGKDILNLQAFFSLIQMNYLGRFLEQCGEDGVTDIVVRLRAGVRRIVVQFRLGLRDLSVLQNVHNFYVSYPASYLMGKKVPSPKKKQLGL
jgi:hypothetical protein